MNDITADRRRPCFLITIDTEGDNLWARSHTITTRNSKYLPRFQQLCENHGLRPTWLVNWEMAQCPVFQEFGRDVLARDAGEIGMHLHAWNSPPIVPLTEDDHLHHPYLIEYPEDQIREKVKVMTETLQDVFSVKMLSHRAGRWGFDRVYARALIDHGYKVDCSVIPHVSWRQYKGDPNGAGGVDYTSFPEHPYFINPDQIDQPGNSPLLEVPVTVCAPLYLGWAASAARMLRRAGALGRRIARRFFPDVARLIPNGRNRGVSLAVLAAAANDGRDHAEFMLHSSEFMPGGSPNFPDERSIEKLYDHMEALFSLAAKHFDGCTLREYYDRFSALHASRRQGAA